LEVLHFGVGKRDIYSGKRS